MINASAVCVISFGSHIHAYVYPVFMPHQTEHFQIRNVDNIYRNDADLMLMTPETLQNEVRYVCDTHAYTHLYTKWMKWTKNTEQANIKLMTTFPFFGILSF